MKLTLDSACQVDLDARTSGGKVECELPVTGVIRPNRVEGKINGGGPNVLLRTSGGTIKVIKSQPL